MSNPQNAATEYIENVKDTVQSFWHGLSITLSYMLRRPITTQYPDRTELPVRDTLPPRYRGFLEVDSAICTGCQACERACPISCIQITLEKDPANPKLRVVSQFDIDEAKCMFCGLCVEPCPTGAIQHTREFEASQRSVRNLTFRWADPEAPFPVYKVPKGAEYFPRVPLGSLVRARLEARRWDAPGPYFLPPEPSSAGKGAATKPGAKAPPAAKAAPAAAPPAAASAPIPKPPPTADGVSKVVAPAAAGGGVAGGSESAAQTIEAAAPAAGSGPDAVTTVPAAPATPKGPSDGQQA